MAEAVVSFVLARCSEWLAPEMVQWLHGYEVKKKVSSLQEKLEWISASLRDAEKKGVLKNETAKIWLSKIRDVAYDAEDAIDDYIYKVQKKYWQRPFRFFGNPLRDASKKIDDILARLDEADKNRAIFSTESVERVAGAAAIASPPSIYSSWRGERILPFVDEVDVVGMEDDASKIAMQLLAESPPRLSVVSIVGMGGLGKTTLAEKICDHSDVRMYFDHRVWVNVTRDWRRGKERQILIEIIKSVASSFRPDRLERMNVGQLRWKLHRLLEKKSCLLVLDDVWEKQAWDALAATFPARTTRSRVLLTTRKKDVALYVGGFIHELKFLGEEESWMLFCKKAFPRDDGHTCPPNLESCGREIVKKCGGLPLAITVLGGLLATKGNHPNEWETVHKTIHWELREGESQIEEILALSYYDLPFHLKPCFHYFSAFPDYSMIRASELIKLWVAEGFISERGEASMEDVAEDCLNELVQRSMVQAVEKSSSGGLKTCRLHDLLWDLSLSKSKQDKFLEVYRDVEPTSPTNARRLVIVDLDFGKCISLNWKSAHLRSLLCFDGVVKSVRGCFKFLRVLTLHGVDIRSKSIEKIGLLIHLRYLGLRNARLGSLPSTIGNLYNLQTLDVRNNCIDVLPDGIWNLKKLRHLRTEYMSIKIPSNVPLDHLSNLQTLATVKPGKWMEDGLAKLKNLSKLKMRGEGLSQYCHIFSKVNLSQLKSLKLVSYDDGPFTAVSSFSCCRHLYSMSLSGQLELSGPHEFSPNLTKLILEGSYLDQNSFTILEMLPNLHILELNYGSYEEEEMVCSSGGFPRLQVFRLHNMYRLEKLIVNEGAVPDLKELNLLNCSHLRLELPERLQHLIIRKEEEGIFSLKSGRFDAIEFYDKPFSLQLYLDGFMARLWFPHQFPPLLTKLALCNSHSEQDFLTVLKQLPNLRILVLCKVSHVGKEMVFTATGFPRLQVLIIHRINELEKFTVKKGGLPSLAVLKIRSCKNLAIIHPPKEFVPGHEKRNVLNWYKINTYSQRLEDSFDKIFT